MQVANQPLSSIERRRATTDAAVAFRATELGGVPARLTSEAAASLLGLHAMVLAALTRNGVVDRLGDPAPNGPKHYHGPYILWLRRNKEFLEHAHQYAQRFWSDRHAGREHKNEKCPQLRTLRTSAQPQKFSSIIPIVPLSLDPLVDSSVAEVILGFMRHEIRILCKAGVLKSVGGTPTRYQHKRFFLDDLLHYHADGKWLNAAEKAVSAYWSAKNRRVAGVRRDTDSSLESALATA